MPVVYHTYKIGVVLWAGEELREKAKCAEALKGSMWQHAEGQRALGKQLSSTQ